MIKNTFEQTPDFVLSACKDNAAVMEGSKIGRWFPDRMGNIVFIRRCAHFNESEVLVDSVCSRLFNLSNT